ncbi:MAG: hypothetical protein ACHQUC_02245 [Chlamydiales bacterium]
MYGPFGSYTSGLGPNDFCPVGYDPYFMQPMPYSSLLTPCVSAVRTTYFVDELNGVHASWVPMVTELTQKVGRVYLEDGTFLCCGLPVGKNHFVLPFHALSDVCLDKLRIGFIRPDTKDFCYQSFYFEVEKNFIAINKKKDCCLLQFREHEFSLPPAYTVGILKLTTPPNDNQFFLLHMINGRMAVSFGNECQGGTRGFCSTVETNPGSSGGIYFNYSGQAFSMHIERSSGLCGGAGEKYGIPLEPIFKTNSALAIVDQMRQRLPQPIESSLCFSTMLSLDPCTIPEVHGTLRSVIHIGEAILVHKDAFDIALNFLKIIKNSGKKEEFFSNIWRNVGTIYKIYNVNLSTGKSDQGFIRLDVQPGPSDDVNLQIQVGPKTIATVLVSKKLYHASKDEIYGVVNYILRKLEEAVIHAEKTRETRVYHVIPREIPHATIGHRRH